jgi:hypothetical protein
VLADRWGERRRTNVERRNCGLVKVCDDFQVGEGTKTRRILKKQSRWKKVAMRMSVGAK